MRFLRYTVAIVVAFTMIAIVPGFLLAQENQSSQGQSSPASPPFPNQPPQMQSTPGNQPVPELKGGMATVIRVDQPDNCLRIRSGPGSAYDVIGCAPMGAELKLSGVWTSNDWAQLADNGWVYGPQIQTDLRPPQTALSPSETYIRVEEGYPIYDFGYLPDYGYSTYWYAGIPIVVYAANIWWRHHPWWWKSWAHHHRKPWHGHQNFYNRRFATPTTRGFAPTSRRVTPTTRAITPTTRAITPTTRAITPTTSAITPTTRAITPTTRGFNAANFSRNITSPYRSSAGLNAFRSGTAASVARSARSFSGPSSFRAGSFGARSFGGHAGGRHR